MHLLIHNTLQSSPAHPWCQVDPSWAASWLHPTVAQLQRLGFEMFCFGNDVYWPWLPVRQRCLALGWGTWPMGLAPSWLGLIPHHAAAEGLKEDGHSPETSEAWAWIFNSSVHWSSSCFWSTSLHKMCNLSFTWRWNSCINSYWVHTKVREKSSSEEREQ